MESRRGVATSKPRWMPPGVSSASHSSIPKSGKDDATPNTLRRSLSCLANTRIPQVHSRAASTTCSRDPSPTGVAPPPAHVATRDLGIQHDGEWHELVQAAHGLRQELQAARDRAVAFADENAAIAASNAELACTAAALRQQVAEQASSLAAQTESKAAVAHVFCKEVERQQERQSQWVEHLFTSWERATRALAQARRAMPRGDGARGRRSMSMRGSPARRAAPPPPLTTELSPFPMLASPLESACAPRAAPAAPSPLGNASEPARPVTPTIACGELSLAGAVKARDDEGRGGERPGRRRRPSALTLPSDDAPVASEASLSYFTSPLAPPQAPRPLLAALSDGDAENTPPAMAASPSSHPPRPLFTNSPRVPSSAGISGRGFLAGMPQDQSPNGLLGASVDTSLSPLKAHCLPSPGAPHSASPALRSEWARFVQRTLGHSPLQDHCNVDELPVLARAVQDLQDRALRSYMRVVLLRSEQLASRAAAVNESHVGPLCGGVAALRAQLVDVEAENAACNAEVARLEEQAREVCAQQAALRAQVHAQANEVVRLQAALASEQQLKSVRRHRRWLLLLPAGLCAVGMLCAAGLASAAGMRARGYRAGYARSK